MEHDWGFLAGHRDRGVRVGRDFLREPGYEPFVPTSRIYAGQADAANTIWLH